MQTSIFTQVLLPLCLFVIMLGMGMSLVIGDFRRVLVFPKAVFVGLACQMLVLPAAGFAIASVLDLPPAFALGLMLLAACPGGTMSNLITFLAKGDIALSITLTAFSSLMTFFTIPLIVAFGFYQFMGEQTDIQLPVGQMLGTLFAVTILPISLGMLIRAKYDAFALRQEKRVSQFSLWFMLFLVVAISAQERHQLLDMLVQTGLAAGALNVITMAIGYLSARLSRLQDKQVTSISIEAGVQNSALAMMIATTILELPSAAIPAAIYSLLMYVSSGIFIGLREKGVL